MSQLVELQPVDQSNWEECANLAVCEEQRNLICSNDRALAEAGFRSDISALAITIKGRAVGLVTLVEASDHVEIHRLMIACADQHHGYGRDALAKILEHIAQSGRDSVVIKFLHWNERAESIYYSVGFRDTGTRDEDEKVFALTLTGSQN